MTERDNRSPVWGGGTIGLLVGLIVGIFRDPFLDTVLWGTVTTSKVERVTDLSSNRQRQSGRL